MEVAVLSETLVPVYQTCRHIREDERQGKVKSHEFYFSSCCPDVRVLVGKPEIKRPLGRPRRRWEDNIKMDLEEVGRGCGDWSWLRIGTGGGRL